MVIRTRIDLLNKSNRVINKYDAMCLYHFHNSLHAYQKAAKYARFRFESPFIKENQVTQFVNGLSKLWFWGDFFKDPERIAVEKTFTFDLEKVTGFQFYSILSLLRNIESYGAYLNDSKFKFDEFSSGTKEESGKYLMEFVCDGKHGNGYASQYYDGHSIWPTCSDHPRSTDYKFNGFIDIPDQDSLKESQMWNARKGYDPSKNDLHYARHRFKIIPIYCASNTK